MRSIIILPVLVSLLALGLPDEGEMPPVDGAVTWLNSPPLKSKALRNKVVLVNIWTYSCINSLRELPYMKAWSEKYRNAGLVVLGVHTPEFGFEEDPVNVKTAVASLKIGYPVPVDSKRAIWDALHNEYWPANYIVDGKGRIRYHHFGEGDYGVSERVIQQLLKENGSKDFDTGLVQISASGSEAPASNDVRSPETYAGSERAERFVSHPNAAVLHLNQWGLIGPWKSLAESSELKSASGKILFRFHARDLHMVLGPTKPGGTVPFRIRIDGVSPGENHGVDSDFDGSGEVRVPRMYQLIRQKGPILDRTFEIEFLEPGVEVYSFTFG